MRLLRWATAWYARILNGRATPPEKFSNHAEEKNIYYNKQKNYATDVMQVSKIAKQKNKQTNKCNRYTIPLHHPTRNPYNVILGRPPIHYPQPLNPIQSHNKPSQTGLWPLANCPSPFIIFIRLVARPTPCGTTPQPAPSHKLLDTLHISHANIEHVG